MVRPQPSEDDMKNLDERIQIARELINRRQEIDEALILLFGGGSTTSKKAQKCSACGEPGHRASTCPQSEAQEAEPASLN
jgi:siroheme synthase (precorrin-2 oxidase/ferrochelatase)